MMTPKKRGISELLNDATEEFQNSLDESPRTRRRLDSDGAQAEENSHSRTGAADVAGISESKLKDKDPTSTPNSKNDIPAAAAPRSGPSLESPTENFFLSFPDLSTSKPKSVPFQQPSPLITFSYTPEHVLEFTNSAMRYYVQPPVGSNLSYGYERFVKRPDERGRLDSLLTAISKVKNDPDKKGNLPEIGVVSWRGIMTKILTAPYDDRDAWELNVMYVNGTLYLEEHLSEARLSEKNNMTSKQRTQTYYGYAFESYCTSSSPLGQTSIPHAPSGWGGDVNTNAQWCSVVRTKLGDTRMIIGGEVDCVRGKFTGQTDNFVELKTSLAIRGKFDEEKFEKKLLKFYFQSFLLGVPEIVVGFRTPAGIVTTVQSFKTIQLPRLVRDKPGAWDPRLCLDWGYCVMRFLKNAIDEGKRDDGARVCRAKFTPGSGVSFEELDPYRVDEVTNGEDRVGFLPKWYWEEIMSEEHGTKKG